MSKAPRPSATPEEIIADALNEQGYLFQRKVATIGHQSRKKTDHSWQLEAAEVPVSLPSGEEARIDLVLRNGRESVPVQVVIECKRLARDYQRWVFFAQSEIIHTPSPNFYYAEKAHLSGTWHQITRAGAEHCAFAPLHANVNRTCLQSLNLRLEKLFTIPKEALLGIK